MKRLRRNAIVYLSLCSLALLLNPGCSDSPNGFPDSNEGWIINENGSFNLRFQDISLTDCFPAMNDREIHPTKVTIKREADGGVIQYTVEEGILTIELGSDTAGYKVGTSLTGFETAPDWVMPLAGGEISGADRFYKQGFGFGGASGVFPLPAPKMRIESAVLKENTWSYDSYLFTGLISPDDRTLVFSVYDHKDYQQRSTLYNKQHRIGLIDRHLDSDRIFFETGFAMEGISLSGAPTDLPVLHIRKGPDPYGTLHKMAKDIARYNNISLTKPPRYYYCSWYEFGKDFNMELLTGLVDGLGEMKEKPGIQSIQIDDGYSWYGDWLDVNDNFPDGLEGIAKSISDAGYSPGIWVAPFMVSSHSFIFKEHKEWILKDLNGELLLWGRRPEQDVYVLDASHPKAFEYLRTVFHTLREMGFTTYKTDFMDWGLQDSKRVIRYAPGKTSVQYYVEVAEMIREEIGEESYWLGCISPFQQMVGLVDGVRVSNDVGEKWAMETTVNMFNEMYAGQFYNNVLWQNDPDVLYLRDYSSELTKTEKYSIALYDGMMGGTLTTSCRFPTLKDEDLKLWRFIRPATDFTAALLSDWGVRPGAIIAVREYGQLGSKSVLVVNTTDREVEQELDIAEITGIDTGKMYEWGPTTSLPLGNVGKFGLQLKPHASQLIYIAADGKAPPESLGIQGAL